MKKFKKAFKNFIIHEITLKTILIILIILLVLCIQRAIHLINFM